MLQQATLVLHHCDSFTCSNTQCDSHMLIHGVWMMLDIMHRLQAEQERAQAAQENKNILDAAAAAAARMAANAHTQAEHTQRTKRVLEETLQERESSRLERAQATQALVDAGYAQMCFIDLYIWTLAHLPECADVSLSSVSLHA